ncbi:hypothetical protein QL285_022218 [Trifolium repens]|nr:hypothetical protein QL285_022218 [Trifolium repens]
MLHSAQHFPFTHLLPLSPPITPADLPPPPITPADLPPPEKQELTRPIENQIGGKLSKARFKNTNTTLLCHHRRLEVSVASYFSLQ